MRPISGSTYSSRIQWSKNILSPQSSPISVSAFSKGKYKRMTRRRVIRPKKVSPRSSKSSTGYLVLPEKIPKLLAGPNIMPKRIPPPPSPISRTTTGTISRGIGESAHLHPVTEIRTSKKFFKWLNDNASVIILNSGSFATLVAFSRTDILELRLLSIAGSVSTITYFTFRTPPRIYLPIMWSSIFLLTNAYMVYYIYEERKGSLSKPWTEEEESVYMEHFRTHGVTPRQFEKLLSKASRIILPRGIVLVERGSKFESVYLVIEGVTMARSKLAKKVTAASSVPGNREILTGGDSGAWIGELAFLEKFSNLGGSPSSSIQTNINSIEGAMKPNQSLELDKKSNSDEHKKNHEQHHTNDPSSIIQPNATRIALLSYTASQDSVVLEWTHEDLAEILNSSVDIRGSLTRAMTAAVVGKVVNLYTSKAVMTEPGAWWHWKKE